jgi:hypothetical protein
MRIHPVQEGEGPQGDGNSGHGGGQETDGKKALLCVYMV